MLTAHPNADRLHRGLEMTADCLKRCTGQGTAETGRKSEVQQPPVA